MGDRDLDIFDKGDFLDLGEEEEGENPEIIENSCCVPLAAKGGPGGDPDADGEEAPFDGSEEKFCFACQRGHQKRKMHLRP